jgi:hypothetical protein
MEKVFAEFVINFSDVPAMSDLFRGTGNFQTNNFNLMKIKEQ